MEYKTNIGSSFTIRNIYIIPNQQATIKIYYRDGVEMSKYTIILKGQDYLDWGANDDYLLNYIIKSVCGSGVELLKEDIPVQVDQVPEVKSEVILEQKISNLENKVSNLIKVMGV